MPHHPSMRRLGAIVVAVAIVGCSGSSSGKSDAASSRHANDSTNPSSEIGAAPGPVCPATGRWAQCSVLYRLERAGLAPRLDSTAKPEEKAIGAGSTSFVVKIGLQARFEVFLYADSASRAADAQKLERTQFVNGTAEQTIKRERTLIENANLVGLLTSINSHQRERVSDALTAGPPQPTQP
jgi:hypothetical protein